VKRIPLQGFQEGEIAQLANQVDLLTSLSHPRIIKYKGVTRHHDALNIILESVSYLFARDSITYAAISGMRGTAL